MGLGLAVLGGLSREDTIQRNPDTKKIESTGSLTSLNLGAEVEFHGGTQFTEVLWSQPDPSSW